jgi:hypothetical protein
MTDWNHQGRLTEEQKKRFLDTKTREEFSAVLKELFKDGKAKYNDLGQEVVNHMHFLNGDLGRYE